MSGTYYRPGENRSCCPVCGKEYRASEFRRRWDGLWVCPKDYEERHPQDFVRARPDDMRPAVVAGCCGSDGYPQIATAEAPLCPFPLEPLDNATIGNATSANLSWTTFPGVASYHIYFWEDGESQPTSATYTTTNSSYFVTGLTENTSYRWFVTAADSDGEFRDCSGNARFFTTALPLLACPTLVSPADSSSIEGESTTLEWSAVSGATSYNVYVFPENGARQLLANTASTSYEATGLDLGVTYFWVVTAVNASGESAGCGLRTFSTENTVALSASSYTVYDSQDNATVVILRDGNVGEVTADYATADGTALAPGNYTDTSGTVTWPDGDTASQSVEIAIEALPSVTEYKNSVLYPWEDVVPTADPRACENDHEYKYATGAWNDSEADVVAEAELDVGYSLGEFMGWSFSPTTSVEHPFTERPGEYETIYLHYNHAAASDGIHENLSGVRAALWTRFYDSGVAVGAEIYWTGHYSAGGEYGQGGIWILTSTSTNPYPGIAVSHGPAWGTAPSYPINTFLWAIYDTRISAKRKERAPDDPCSPRCEEAYPDFSLDSSYCLIDSTAVKRGSWAQAAGTYKALAVYAAESNAVVQYPLDPVLPSTDANYSDETYWTTQYDAAVTSGDMEAGLTYGVDYPVVISEAYVRSYKQFLTFDVDLSNATGAQLIAPTSATVYIFPA